ncbi:hypothetical protein [Raoultella terrigena]|uniref:hypothetical protein n=1 Tax=Raoultella terrigena TaxID=577 RepID=UPI001F522C99|nr:hypothetical protein [Raoultella terrigena]MCI1034391.1 hypothetical protein [Raoultella terrigena]
MQKRDNPHKPGALMSMKRDRLRRRRWPDKKAVSQDGEQRTGKRLNENRIVNPLFIKINLFKYGVRRGGQFSPEMGAGSRGRRRGNGKRETESRKAKGGPRQDKKNPAEAGFMIPGLPFSIRTD